MKWASTIPSGGGGSSFMWYLHWLGLTPAYDRFAGCRDCPSELGPSQPGGQLAVAAQRPELVFSAMQEEQDTAAVCSTGGKPVGWPRDRIQHRTAWHAQRSHDFLVGACVGSVVSVDHRLPQRAPS